MTDVALGDNKKCDSRSTAYGSSRNREVATCSMASRRSIAGYLIQKPAGALSRLKGRKRMWFVLDESKCRLLYYKNEGDAQSKDPLGAIDIRGSAISLALEEDHQFVVHSNGREHALVAEDHESMMLWILAMQARQDKAEEPSMLRHKTSSLLNSSQPNQQYSDRSTPSVKSKVLQRTHSLQLGTEKRHDTLKRMHSLWTTSSQDSELIPNGKTTLSKRPPLVEESSRDQTPPSSPPGPRTCSTDTNNNDHDQARSSVIRESSTDRSSETESCDDSDPSDTPDSGSDRIQLLRKMNLQGMTPQEMTPLKDRTRRKVIESRKFSNSRF